MLLKEIAVQLFEHLVDHNWHGYSQSNRWGDGEGVCPVTINGKIYNLKQGDRDCSSAVISAYEAAGISCGGATYTGNMNSCMSGTGDFKYHEMSSGYVAKRGDVYLNQVNHTAMCLSAFPDMLGEFSISETGGIDGAEGDQTGGESHRRSYYDYPWDGILECVCNRTDGGTSTPENPQKNRKNVYLYEFNGGQNQLWKSQKDADGYAKLTCHGNSLCLDIDGAGKKNGTNVQVYTSNNSEAQRFMEKEIKNKNGSSCVELIPKHAPHMRLDCENGGFDNKTNVQLYKSNNSTTQQWYKRLVSGGYTVYFNVNSGRVLDGGGSIK